MADGETPPMMGVAELERFLETEFPQIHHGGRSIEIASVRPMGAVLRMACDERHLRPGGTVSGPAMMALADYAMYVAVLAQIGPVGLAVTTSLSINFLRKPGQGDLLADCAIMKLGRRLAVGEVGLRAENQEGLAAHVVATYSIPDRKVT